MMFLLPRAEALGVGNFIFPTSNFEQNSHIVRIGDRLCSAASKPRATSHVCLLEIAAPAPRRRAGEAGFKNPVNTGATGEKKPTANGWLALHHKRGTIDIR